MRESNIVKHLNFGLDARAAIYEGVDKLYKAVSSTLGASGKSVILEDDSGKPVITKDALHRNCLSQQKTNFSLKGL